MATKNEIIEPKENDLEILAEYKDNRDPEFFPLMVYDLVQAGYPIPNKGIMVARAWGGTNKQGQLTDGTRSSSNELWCKVTDVKDWIKQHGKSDTPTTYEQKLTELQTKIGYVPGPIHAVALLGLMGEVGEVANETLLVDKDKQTPCPVEVHIGILTDRAEQIDSFKKMIRGDLSLQPNVLVPLLKAFDSELSDVYYYLKALAANRGLTMEDLARMSYEKVMSKRQTMGPELLPPTETTNG